MSKSNITFNHINFKGGYMTFRMPMPSIKVGYKGQVDAQGAYSTHPFLIVWKKGQFSNVELVLTLAVDSNEGGLESASALVGVVQNFMKASIGDFSTSSMPSGVARLATMSVQIGTWYFREFFVLGVEAEFRPPWDIDSGIGMVVEITLDLMPFYGNDINKLPEPKTWSFISQ